METKLTTPKVFQPIVLLRPSEECSASASVKESKSAVITLAESFEAASQKDEESHEDEENLSSVNVSNFVY